MVTYNGLRMVVGRLNSTPVDRLPHIAPFLAFTLSSGETVFQGPAKQNNAQDASHGVLLHKLKTKILSLLQGRTAGGRYAAIVLIKAIVESGKYEILSTIHPWLQCLVSQLEKRDPPSVKKLSLITITRVLVLTQQYPSLVREISTPLLLSLISACLNAIKPTVVRAGDETNTVPSPLLETVFHCFLELIPHHPAVFRPFVPRIRAISLSLISDGDVTDDVSQTAAEVVALLHCCSVKTIAEAEWSQGCANVISAAHSVADYVFRSVIEEAEFYRDRERDPNLKDYGGEPRGSVDVTGLSAWTGLHHGSLRLQRLLKLLEKYLSCATPERVGVPIGLILDLTLRLASITVGTETKEMEFSVRNNPEVGREEREELLFEMPPTLVATLSLLSTLIATFGRLILPVINTILEQASWIFRAGQNHPEVCIASYGLFMRLLPIIDSSVTKSDVEQLTPVIRSCCAELLLEARAGAHELSNKTSTEANSKPNASAAINADSFSGAPEKELPLFSAKESSPAYQLSAQLLPLFLQHIPPRLIPHTLRIEIDRTAILQQNTTALLASVLSPPPPLQDRRTLPSTIPFLARARPADLSVEAILRPRIPPVHSGRFTANGAYTDDPTDEEDSMLDADSPDPRGNETFDRLERSMDHGSPDGSGQPAKFPPGPPSWGQTQFPHASSSFNMAAQNRADPEPATTKRDFATFAEDDAADTAANYSEPPEITGEAAPSIWYSSASEAFKKPRVSESENNHDQQKYAGGGVGPSNYRDMELLPPSPAAEAQARPTTTTTMMTEKSTVVVDPEPAPQSVAGVNPGMETTTTEEVDVVGQSVTAEHATEGGESTDDDVIPPLYMSSDDEEEEDDGEEDSDNDGDAQPS